MAKQTRNDKIFHESGWWVAFAFIGFVLMLMVYNISSATKEITWKEFESRIASRKAVKKIVVVNKETAMVYIKPEFADDPYFIDVFRASYRTKNNSGPHYSFDIGSVEAFENRLDVLQKGLPVSEQMEISYEDRSRFSDLLLWLVPLIAFIFFFRLMISGRSDRGTPNVFTFRRSNARLLENENLSSTTFADVAGLEEAKLEVKEIVDFLKEPTRYTKLGAKIPKGVIIVGPPGTGKTLLAKAVAGEAKVPFFSISGSEFVEMFVGVGASRVRDLFTRAKEKAPCIVFIDEIDAVGRTRGRNAMYSGVNDERESTLNQLLTEMDGFGTNTGVIVLAATNRADVLDPALLRPGRFDRHIYLELPTQIERREIFKVHLKPLILDTSVDVEFLASQTPGFSGADIANICNEAALIAARHQKDKVERQDFLDAMDRIIAGLEKKSKIISDEEKKIIACHEAGHAVASWFLKNIDPLVKVSIIPRGKSLGAAWYLPEERQILSRQSYRDRLVAALAGRAAEEITFGEISSGALDDLTKVTREAYGMVAYYGFNEVIGNISFLDPGGLNESSIHKPYSEETGRLIDQEVRKLVSACYDDAKELLQHHRQGLVEVTRLLLEREVVYKNELENVLGIRGTERIPLQPVHN